MSKKEFKVGDEVLIRGTIVFDFTSQAEDRHIIVEVSSEFSHGNKLRFYQAEKDIIHAKKKDYTVNEYNYLDQKNNLETENAKLREALSFYADIKNSYMIHDSGDGFINTSNIDLDNGKKARDALGVK